jgi:hypothetical protein
MKKHLQNDHIKKFNKYKAKVKAKDGGATKCQKFKKRMGVPPSSIIDFFSGGTSYSKKDHVQFQFIQDLVFHVCKGYQNISIVESYWLKRLVMKKNLKIKFPIRSQFVNDISKRVGEWANISR